MVSNGTEVRVSVCGAQGLSVLNFLMSPKEGISELSYQLAQPEVGQEGMGKRRAGKLSAIKHQKWIQTLYYMRVGKICAYISEWPILVFEICLLIANIGYIFLCK